MSTVQCAISGRVADITAQIKCYHLFFFLFEPKVQTIIVLFGEGIGNMLSALS
jgi:hypothetical protein